MDLGCWISVFVSYIFTSLALVIVVKVGASYGMKRVDVVKIILTPFAMMNHEGMPSWFEMSTSPATSIKVIRRGRAGNLLLLTWSVMGMIIMFGFTCNLRAIYMNVDYEKPLDTAEAIYKSGRTVTINSATFWLDFLQTSGNPWHRLIANTSERYGSKQEEATILRRIALGDGDEVAITPISGRADAWMTHEVKSNKTFAKQYLSGNGVHLAKERVSAIVFGGWAVQKDSPWREALNKYILLLEQVLGDKNTLNHVYHKVAWPPRKFWGYL